MNDVIDYSGPDSWVSHLSWNTGSGLCRSHYHSNAHSARSLLPGKYLSLSQDASGAMHTATVSATTTQRAEPKPTPPPSNSSQPADSKKETVKVLSTARDPPPISTSTTTSSTTSSRSQRLAEQAEEREAELQRLETERNQRQLRSIHTHSRTVRRCIQFATKILDRFDVSRYGMVEKYLIQPFFFF